MKDVFSPVHTANRKTVRLIVAVWLFCVGVFWCFSPSMFLPKPSEVAQAVHDLWFYQNLGISLLSSVQLNLEAIAIAAILSVALAYLGTIPAFRPAVNFIGKLRFLSFAGLGFAFTLMATDEHALKVSVLVFMVVVFFVVSMVDIINQIPREQYDLARTLCMGDWETLYEVVILGQSDQAFIVLRQTAAMSWMFLATSESMAMSGGGMGVLLSTSDKHFHLADVMALQILVLIIGLLQDKAIGVLRNTCCPWVLAGRK